MHVHPSPRRAAVALVAGGLALAASCAFAQPASTEWPARPIRIIVAQAPGGPPDRIARFVAEPLARALKVPVTIENRPGASGIIGAEAAMRAAPDGHTLLIATLSTHVLVPATTGQAPFDAVRDFAPVINLHRSVKVLWVPSTLPPRSLAEFVAHARAQPGVLNFATGGAGSSNHVDFELFRQATGVDLVHVPYNGPAAGIAAVAGGEAQAMIVSVTTGAGPLQAGRVRALVVFAGRRSTLLPEVPTAAQAGLGDLDLSAWIGLVAPANTPVEIVERLNGELQRILREPASLAWADAQGLEIVGGSRADFAATIENDRRRWARVIGEMGIGRR
ncbi:hypothetical protein BURK1_01875 [Burkholderiales bacterium]|nr:hypothetical protein BURK1_01875 [Burkholderiales bacterium]